MRERGVPLESILTVEPLALELGMDLVSLVDNQGGNLILHPANTFSAGRRAWFDDSSGVCVTI